VLNLSEGPAKHQRSVEELRPLEIPTWKWDSISMDFIMGLPHLASRKNAIWVILDRITKSGHFLSIQGNSATIWSNQGYNIQSQSEVSSLVLARQRAFGTKLNCNSSYHPKTTGQIERVNQTLEDMLWIVFQVFKENGRSIYPW